MSPEDGAYYQMRAEQEVELAQRSTDPAAVQLHYALTELYLEKLHGVLESAATALPGSR